MLTVRFVVSLSLLALVLGCSPGPPPAPDSRPDPAVRTVEETWPNGRLRLRKQVLQQPDGEWVDNGSYERWYDDGVKEYEATFVLGKKEGTTVRYHRNGQKWTEQVYKNGLRDGPSITWDESGAKIKEENWLAGQPHGVWTVWEDGEIKWRHRFEHGVPAVRYDPDPPPDEAEQASE